MGNRPETELNRAREDVQTYSYMDVLLDMQGGFDDYLAGMDSALNSLRIKKPEYREPEASPPRTGEKSADLPKRRADTLDLFDIPYEWLWDEPAPAPRVAEPLPRKTAGKHAPRHTAKKKEKQPPKRAAKPKKERPPRREAEPVKERPPRREAKPVKERPPRREAKPVKERPPRREAEPVKERPPRRKAKPVKERPPRKKPAEKKAGKTGDVVFYTVMVLLVLGSFLIHTFSGGNSVKTFAGFSAFLVKSSSMEAVYPKDSVILSRTVPAETLKIGDDITFFASENTIITHRIIAIYEDYESTGARGFETKGVMNESPDKSIVPAVNVIGKVVFCSPFIGNTAVFIREQWPILLFAAAVITVLLLVLKKIFKSDSNRKGETS